ncbi:hypothetical protein CHUAL_008606 [Chamberlinius hualienensis]
MIRQLILKFLSTILFLAITDWSSAASPVLLSRPTCPDSGQNLEIYQGATPYANISAGIFTKLPKVFKLDECVDECCYSENCHYAFFPNGICFMITCRSNKFCEPLPRNGAKFDDTYLVKVRDPDGTMIESNEELLDMDQDHEQITDKVMTVHRSSNEDMYTECLYNSNCANNEECLSVTSNPLKRRCECINHLIRDPSSGKCISAEIVSPLMQPLVSESLILENRASGTNTNASTTTTTATSSVKPVTTSAPPDATTSNLRHLVVSAGEDKIVQLPNNEVTLSAYALPKESDGEQYKYKWTLVSPKSEATGSMSDTNSPSLKLSDLKEGSYTFKVAVSSDSAYGEAFANVTVLRPVRENKPPVAKINPVSQTVKLPNSDTILDGSASEDDDKIVKYVWEMVQAPIGYSPQLTQTATLQLKNLVAGNYRIILTVTDSDGVTNSTLANLNVTKETDYPPTALIEPDVIIYLPQNEVTINGNGSWDDKGIKSWEWTKGDGMDRAVDMQNTRTPYLHLSNLDVGMYTLELKVTDTADQSSTAQVHLFVKPGNEGPVADAGKDLEIMLPTNSVILDGSASHDDIGVSRWEWKQVSGPTQSTIESADQAKTTVTNLSAGVYVFQLTVYDDKSSNSKTVAVTVASSKNDPPKANAGGDQSIELPCNLVILNGSASTDDNGITKYEWTRDSASLAVGEILHGTDHTSLLMLTGLLPGRYVFKLTVYDAGGVSSSDTASVIVKTATHELDDVEICIANDIASFNEEQKVTIAKKIALLLQEELETTVIITNLVSERNTNRVIITFHVERISYGGKITIEAGVNVVKNLKKRLKADAGIFGIPIVYIDTTICQNNCSGHGFCDKFTKRCTCEAFWMENFFAFYFSDQESNCDWSILYVTICIFVIIIALVICSWGIVCLCAKKKKKSHSSSSYSNSRHRLFRVKRRQRYTLLENNSEHESVRMLPKSKSPLEPSLMISDSDLESDLIFEKNGKPEIKPAVAFSNISRNSDEDENSTQQLRM